MRSHLPVCYLYILLGTLLTEHLLFISNLGDLLLCALLSNYIPGRFLEFILFHISIYCKWTVSIHILLQSYKYISHKAEHSFTSIEVYFLILHDCQCHSSFTIGIGNNPPVLCSNTV